MKCKLILSHKVWWIVATSIRENHALWTRIQNACSLGCFTDPVVEMAPDELSVIADTLVKMNDEEHRYEELDRLGNLETMNTELPPPEEDWKSNLREGLKKEF